MAVVELDPFFVKALKLLQSRSKESTDQLKQMLVEALANKKVKADLSSFAMDEDDRWELARASSPARTHSIYTKSEPIEHGKKRDTEKRTHDKVHIKTEPSDHLFEPKKPKLEARPSPRPSPSPTPEPRTEKSKDREKSKESHKDKTKESHKEKSKDGHKEKSSKDDRHSDKSRDRDKDRDRAHRDKDRERMKEKEKEKEREREREREKEREKEKERQKAAEINWSLPTDDSDNDDDMQMDADSFALNLGVTCIVCKQMNQSSGNQLVECQECHNLYHQACHRPPYTEQDVNDPRFVWYCSRCTKNMKKMVTKPSKPKVPPIIIPKETVIMTKTAKVETPTMQLPFKRVLDTVKPPASKELASSSSRGQGMGLAGLASLAANFSGKDPTKLKISPTDATKMKSPFEPPKLSRSETKTSTPPLSSGPAAMASTTASKPEKRDGKSKTMNPDKRLQMMKKKAAEKQLSKRLK